MAQAHDTISFDPNAPSKFSLNGSWGQSTPTVLHGLATARLRPDGLEIELTMADGAAYKLLDPGAVTTGVANATNDVNDTEFAQDEPLLIKRARTFFIATNNGAELAVGSVSIELTAARDTIFRIIFPSPKPGSLRLAMTYLGQIPTGQKDLLTVVDRDGVTLASATLDRENPALEVSLPAPGSPNVGGGSPKSGSWLILVVSGVFALTLLVLLNKLRQHGTGR